MRACARLWQRPRGDLSVTAPTAKPPHTFDFPGRDAVSIKPMTTRTDPATSTEDHRTRVAAQRREKTRQKLLECALDVLRVKSPDAVVADDFIAAAGVSRGTFYNHFDTTHDIIFAVATAMSDEFAAAVNDYIITCSSPLERLSAGTRLYMQMTLRFPIWGRLLSRIGARIAVRGQPIETYVTRDLTNARDAGLIQVRDVLVARDMVIGGIYYGIGTMAAEPTQSDHPQALIEAILRGLRVPDKLIESLAYGPLPTLSNLNGPMFSKLKEL